MKSIILIVPYFGKWPVWFEAHLISISRNREVDWLFITDCEIPVNYPQNVRFIPSTLENLNKKINYVLQVNVPLSPRKLCDIRPAYGAVFQKYIVEYDFWGFCDLDIIWGDIRKFITDDILEEYHIISSRYHAVSGHFTILKNIEYINTLYKKIPFYIDFLSERKLMRADEEAFTDYLKVAIVNDADLKVYWKRYLMNNKHGMAHQEYYLDKWIWKDGKMMELINGRPFNEVMYLHFINWKSHMKFSEINFFENPREFYISYTGIHYKPHSSFVKVFNSLKNLFNGYWINDRRRIKINKFKSLKKRVRNKLKKIIVQD